MEIGDRVVVVAKVGMEQMEQPKESLGAEEIRALSLSLSFSSLGMFVWRALRAAASVFGHRLPQSAPPTCLG